MRARPSWKQHQWVKLLNDLQLIIETAFDFLGPTYAQFQYFKVHSRFFVLFESPILTITLQTLLKANQFQLAREFVREAGSQLKGVDDLVFDAAREHFNSCTVLDEEVSIHFPITIHFEISLWLLLLPAQTFPYLVIDIDHGDPQAHPQEYPRAQSGARTHRSHKADSKALSEHSPSTNQTRQV